MRLREPFGGLDREEAIAVLCGGIEYILASGPVLKESHRHYVDPDLRPIRERTLERVFGSIEAARAFWDTNEAAIYAWHAAQPLGMLSAPTRP